MNPVVIIILPYYAQNTRKTVQKVELFKYSELEKPYNIFAVYTDV